MEVLTEIPNIRYVSVTPGSKKGVCPRCKRSGLPGTYCYKCCTAMGAYIGTCDMCNQCGVIGEPCEQCPYEEYLDEVPYGTCAHCGGHGEQHAPCRVCKNKDSTYV
jgi:hypothetical protein